MPRTIAPDGHRPTALASADDVWRIFGDVDTMLCVAILALQPTVADLEEASIWAYGDSDMLAAAGHAQTGTIARIAEIVAADDEDEESAPH